MAAGAGFAARRIHQLRVLAGRTGWPEQRLSPSLDFPGDLDAPMRLIRRDLKGYFCALDAARVPTSGKAFIDPNRGPNCCGCADRLWYWPTRMCCRPPHRPQWRCPILLGKCSALRPAIGIAYRSAPESLKRAARLDAKPSSSGSRTESLPETAAKVR